MTLTQPQIDELKQMIAAALHNLYDYDFSLIERKANERSIAFRFGLYFSQILTESSFGSDNDLTIDFDYNRNGYAVKGMQGFSKSHGVYPDIILHHRGYNDKNILVIEFKGIWNNNNTTRNADIIKLKGFTHIEENDYHYGLGAFIDLAFSLNDCATEYF
jgi:hypothetical protein